jgi:lysophospholipase
MLNADLKEFEFTSSFDELVISAVIAVPAGDVCGVVQLVHGLNEHKERYYPFMDYLAEEGFITVIHDCRGHGKSICTPDDLGFMFRKGGDGFVSDIAQLNKIIRETYPKLPFFMIAQGMGSVGARCYIKEHDEELNGLVLLGTPCYSRFSPVTRCIRAVSSKKPGSRFRSEKIYNTIDDTFGKFFEEPENSWRCSDPEVVSAFNNDPLCNFMVTLNGYEEMLRLTRQAYSSNGWQLKNPSLPVRFVSGKDDPCLISEKKFFAAVYSLEKSGYESISHRLFDGMRHDILNEKNNINVWKDIAKTLFSWIDRYNDSVAELSAGTDSETPTDAESI